MKPPQRGRHLPQVDEGLEVVGGGSCCTGCVAAVGSVGVFLAADAEFRRFSVGNVLLFLPFGPPILKPNFHLKWIQ